MFNVMIRRILNGRSIFYPDRNHLHLLLVDYGVKKDKVFYILVAIFQWLTCSSITLVEFNERYILFLSSTILMILIIYFSKEKKSTFKSN